MLTPKPTSDAGDVVWSTYRETQTLDPIQAFDYPENTVDPLLCDSLLRQAPDQTLGPGIATYTAPSATEYDFTLERRREVLGRHPGDRRGRRLQPRAGHGPQGRRLLRRRSSTG